MEYIAQEKDNNLFKVEQKDCIFMTEGQFQKIEKSYAYVTDDNINQFINQVQVSQSISTLMICQDFFYQKIDAWCDFQDQIASLFTHLPGFKSLKDIYLKFDIYSPSTLDQFRKINLEEINFLENNVISCKNQSRSSSNGQSLFQKDYNNFLDILTSVVDNCQYFKENVNIHLIMHICQGQNTKHFIDSISNINNLRSLEIKYYCDQSSDENQNIQADDNNSTNRNLFFNLTRQISKCQSLNNLKLIIPNANKLTPISVNGKQGSFSQEVMQLTSALSQCKKLSKVSLHLPIQFFFLDYLKQKNIQEQTINANLRMLSKNKSIKVFELHLIKFKNTPNMRRRTQQINDLVQYLKKGIVNNLSHLVHYQS